MAETIIEITGLSHCYRTFSRSGGLLSAFKDFTRRNHVETWALQDLDLSISRGEIIGILGPNGAGKTTLLKVISGLLHPTAGQVTVCGHTPHRKKAAFLQQIGVVLGQRSQLQWDLPAIDTLNLLRHIYGIPADVYKARLDLLLDMLDIRHRLGSPVRTLSLGERMKFELIAALLHSPKLLFLDEPTIGLDVISQRAIRNFLAEINQHDQTTILVTSHYMRDIEILSNRVAVMSEGGISFLGSSAELIKRLPFKHRVVFTTDIQPNLAQWNITQQQNGEFSVACEPGELGQLLHQLTACCQLENIRTEIPTLEDAAVKLMSPQQ